MIECRTDGDTSQQQEQSHGEFYANKTFCYDNHVHCAECSSDKVVLSVLACLILFPFPLSFQFPAPIIQLQTYSIAVWP